MSDSDDAKKALSTLGVGPAAAELYVDLLRPAAKEMGSGLLTVARLIRYAFAPLDGAVWGLDKVRDWLSAALLGRLAQVAPENIQTPPPYVAGQILLQLPFCAEQERLREMYANLLAAAMNKEYAADVHPAFVHVIQQLTPDEAKVLRHIAARPMAFELQEVTNQDGSLQKGQSSLSDQFRHLCKAAGVDRPDSSDAYLDNLLRLKLFSELQWTEGEFHAAGWNDHGEYGASIENAVSRTLQLSAFAEKFLKTCVGDHTPGASAPALNT